MPVLRRAEGLAWFKNEHDEAPGAPSSPTCPPTQLAELGDELMRTRDGQLVLGRAVAGRGGRALEAREYARALETFTCWRRSTLEVIEASPAVR